MTNRPLTRTTKGFAPAALGWEVVYRTPTGETKTRPVAGWLKVMVEDPSDPSDVPDLEFVAAIVDEGGTLASVEPGVCVPHDWKLLHVWRMPLDVIS